MADFRSHTIGACALGGLAAGIATYLGTIPAVDAPVVALAGFTGALAPDLDHDQSRPTRILFRAAAVILPAVVLWRVPLLRQNVFDATISYIVLAITVRVPLARLFGRFTVHRGSFHTLAAATAFGAGLCWVIGPDRSDFAPLSIASGLAGTAGYLVHLLLDEASAVRFDGSAFHTRRSLGTALKIRGSTPWSTAAIHLLACGLLWGCVDRLAGFPMDSLITRDPPPIGSWLSASQEAFVDWLRALTRG